MTKTLSVYKYAIAVGAAFMLAAALLVLLFTSGTVRAALTGGPDIIPAPASVVDDPPGATNDHQQAFDEAQNVVLSGSVTCDNGVVLSAGSRVNSHMIFLNTVGGTFATDTQTWAFDDTIVCVMSDFTGSLEVASSPVLGAPGTTYPAAAFSARGMEGSDSYTVSGNSITVTMSVTEPGDWIRVVTEVPPVSASVDVKPQSCPNPVNTENRGVLPLAVLGTDDFDVSEIDPATVELEGVSPLRWDTEDVATPFDGEISDPAQRDECTDEGADGFTDLTLKFDTQDVLDAFGAVSDGDVVVVSLTGELTDGQPFEGVDVVWIKDKGNGGL